MENVSSTLFWDLTHNILLLVQSKFSSRSRAWLDMEGSTSTTSRIRMRMDHELSIPTSALAQYDLHDRAAVRALFRDEIQARARDLALELTMSSVTGLADLIEDEIFPEMIPLRLDIDNIRLLLIEDRPPSNITSPGPVPIRLRLDRLIVDRDTEGRHLFVILKL